VVSVVYQNNGLNAKRKYKPTSYLEYTLNFGLPQIGNNIHMCSHQLWPICTWQQSIKITWNGQEVSVEGTKQTFLESVNTPKVNETLPLPRPHNLFPGLFSAKQLRNAMLLVLDTFWNRLRASSPAGYWSQTNGMFTRSKVSGRWLF